MKIFKVDEFITTENPEPGNRLHKNLLSDVQGAIKLGGVFVALPPGGQVPYHYHEKRESIIYVISGQAIENVEGEEFAINAGDIIFIPANEKHGMKNTSDSESCYLEFFTVDGEKADRIDVPE